MDDLDAFFDEVDEVEEEVKKQGEGRHDGKPQDDSNIGKENNQLEEVEPPSKKARIQEEDSAPATKGLSAGSGSNNTGRGTVVVSRKAVVVTSVPPSHPTKSQQKEPVIHHITVPEPIVPIQQSIIPPPPPPLPTGLPNNAKNKSVKRTAAGKTWTDNTLSDFPENDYRLFVGNLAKDISEAKLAEAFSSKYPSFVMARIIYDKTNQTSKGYGFVSLLDARDCARAMREMDQSWLGSRPIKVKRSDWKERDFKEVKKGKKSKNKKKHMW